MGSSEGQSEGRGRAHGGLFYEEEGAGKDEDDHEHGETWHEQRA